MTKTFEEFVKVSAGTKLDTNGGVLGLVGEVGEVADYFKKVCYHDVNFDREKMLSEMGDVMWYFTFLRLKWGFSSEEVMKANIEKLTKRGHAKGFDPNYHKLNGHTLTEEQEHA